MEKTMKSKRSNNFLSFLAKSTSFSNPAPLKPSHQYNKGFSGPLIHLVPTEARHKGKADASFETQEPTSPIVSCIGQIKQKAKKNRLPRAKSIKRRPLPKPEKKPKNNKNTSFVQRVFGHGKPNSRRKLELSRSDNSLASTVKVPTLEHMRRYKSGRETLKGFDWRQVETEVKSKDKEEDDMTVYYSAPLVLDGGAVGPEPRKEVNLWKRRTIGAPVPLKLDEL
ncbi:Syringolide-induced protein 14-1-1 [Rhynchospora pubera]|uniref:Syringolide-induced protein 14-1-1 n=1 Tax=Rhynchospora pubera TaxID=906938 RepID=A0AAV8E651_9POAL|nr:Syringolide-induced protein 14-1-1 [Rhynchospora pubera]KAJ4776945.1 Syringolide-induced protein 14-1-1 [Rhynchospora pubera]